MFDNSYKPVRNPKMEVRIIESKGSPDAWSAYADWLLKKGDPRGEVMALELSLEQDETDEKVSKDKQQMIDDYYRKYRDVWRGSANKHPDFYIPQNVKAFKYGFVNAIQIKSKESSMERCLDALISNQDTRGSDLLFVEDLILSHNDLHSLPEQIKSLTYLTMLDVSNNQLETMPESIGSLSRLTDLFIYENKFFRLPDALCELNKLERVYCSRDDLNRLRDYPDPEKVKARVVLIY